MAGNELALGGAAYRMMCVIPVRTAGAAQRRTDRSPRRNHGGHVFGIATLGRGLCWHVERLRWFITALYVVSASIVQVLFGRH
eukprot:scaffold243473_cov26-Tisochrysis_lutea.AAC.9